MGEMGRGGGGEAGAVQLGSEGEVVRLQAVEAEAALRRGVDARGAEVCHGVAVGAVDGADGALQDANQEQGLLSGQGRQVQLGMAPPGAR